MLALRLFKREFSVGAASLAGRGRDSPARELSWAISRLASFHCAARDKPTRAADFARSRTI